MRINHWRPITTFMPQNVRSELSRSHRQDVADLSRPSLAPVADQFAGSAYDELHGSGIGDGASWTQRSLAVRQPAGRQSRPVGLLASLRANLRRSSRAA